MARKLVLDAGEWGAKMPPKRMNVNLWINAEVS
jgi:hypothetical protein